VGWALAIEKLFKSSQMNCIPLLVTYLETGLGPRVPTAILSVALVIVGVIGVFTGLILDMTTKTRREMKRLIYLSLPAFP
jgi:hypothetical protein